MHSTFIQSESNRLDLVSYLLVMPAESMIYYFKMKLVLQEMVEFQVCNNFPAVFVAALTLAIE